MRSLEFGFEAMVDANGKKQKKGEFSEEDVCDLLQRYNAMQVLVLLREVAQSTDGKIDWNDMVKKTETGITNAKEIQLLWRHIAYRHPLAEKIEEGDQPLDDDSDMEYELEPSPPVSTEVSMEVANCVKVLAFGSASESSMPNSSAVESDMPNGHSSKPPSENRHSASLLHSSNITPTVSVQKQPQAAGPSGDGFDNNYPSRRKRKPWSEDEDSELIAAVKKFGESNWANIVKGEFKGDRTASQLSQRWSIIKKRKLGLNIGGASSSAEQHMATRRALDMALKDNVTGGCGTVGNGAAANNNNPNPNVPNGDTPTPSNTVKPGGAMGIKALPRPPVVKQAGPTKPPSVSDPIQAAAVAAGARIASPSDAATLFKAAQSKNAVRIMGGGTSLIKSTSPTGSSPLPPNVHFIRTGLAATSMATGTPPLPPKGSVLKPSVPAASSLSHLPKAKNAPSSSTATEPKQVEQKASTEVKVPVSDVKPVMDVREGNASSLSSKCLPKAPESTSKDTVPSKPTVDGDNAQCATSKDTTENEGRRETPLGNEKKSTDEGSSVVNGGGVAKAEASDETDKSEPMD